MKLLEMAHDFKTVEVWGLVIHQVPVDCKSIAVDEDGAVYAYADIAKKSERGNAWTGDAWTGDDYTFVARVDLEGMDWRDTLVKI